MSRYRYILNRHPIQGESLMVYTPDEVRSLFTPEESAQLGLGHTIRKNGRLWTDMVIASREKLEAAIHG